MGNVFFSVGNALLKLLINKAVEKHKDKSDATAPTLASLNASETVTSLATSPTELCSTIEGGIRCDVTTTADLSAATGGIEGFGVGVGSEVEFVVEIITSVPHAVPTGELLSSSYLIATEATSTSMSTETLPQSTTTATVSLVTQLPKSLSSSSSAISTGLPVVSDTGSGAFLVSDRTGGLLTVPVVDSSGPTKRSPPNATEPSTNKNTTKPISNGTHSVANTSTLTTINLDDPGLFFCKYDDDNDAHMAAREKTYFEFTETNLEESRVSECYANWTAAYGQTLDWQKMGEVNLFAWHFAETGDYNCWFNHEGTCPHTPIIDTLFRLYPGQKNWPHIRRIVFMFEKFNRYHQFVRLYNDKLNKVHHIVKDNVADLLDVFTPNSPNIERKYICRLWDTLMAESSKRTINLARFGGVFPNQTAYGIPVVGITDTIAAGAIQSIRNNLRQFVNSAAVADMDAFRATGGWATDYAEPTCYDVNAGMDAKTIRTVTNTLGSFFDDLENLAMEGYEALFRGNYTLQDDQSALSVLMRDVKFLGPASISEAIRNSEAWGSALEKDLIKSTAAELLKNSRSYVKCTYEKDAQHHCETARNGKHNSFSNAIFCPRPTTEPTLICVAARIKIDDHGDTREDSIPIVPDFASGDSERLGKFASKYRLSFDELMLENDANFLEKRKTGSSSRSFQLPTCIHEHLKLSDFTVNRTKNYFGAFPLVCGDHRSNETEAFVRDISINSAIPNQADIFFDRMPRALKGLSAYEYFMTLCRLHVVWPQQTRGHLFSAAYLVEKLRLDSVHTECAAIEEATKGMDYVDANDYFCSYEIQRKLRWDGVFSHWGDYGRVCIRWKSRDDRLGPKPTSEEIQRWNAERDGVSQLGMIAEIEAVAEMAAIAEVDTIAKMTTEGSEIAEQ